MFTHDTLKFLRALKRNNDREWFKARKDKYEEHVRGPMIAVIERLARDFQTFAPEIVASPKTSLYRIYRDTRFSDNKTPLKTQVSASFRWKGLPKGEGAGLYLEVHPQWVWMGGGFWAPPAPQLVRIRAHIADTFPEIDRLSHSKSFASVFGMLDGEKLTRVPRGYPKDHPAAEYLEVQAVPGGSGVSPRVCNQRRVLPSTGPDLQSRNAADPVPQRAALTKRGAAFAAPLFPSSAVSC